jgi:hypothetical protein
MNECYRANLWPVQTEQCAWDVILRAAIAVMETGRQRRCRWRGDQQGEPDLDAGVELAERGAPGAP